MDSSSTHSWYLRGEVMVKTEQLAAARAQLEQLDSRLHDMQTHWRRAEALGHRPFAYQHALALTTLQNVRDLVWRCAVERGAELLRCREEYSAATGREYDEDSSEEEMDSSDED